jgi:hypothetical protein
MLISILVSVSIINFHLLLLWVMPLPIIKLLDGICWLNLLLFLSLISKRDRLFFLSLLILFIIILEILINLNIYSISILFFKYLLMILIKINNLNISFILLLFIFIIMSNPKIMLISLINFLILLKLIFLIYKTIFRDNF